MREIEAKLKQLTLKNDNIIGWSNKIRDGKIRIYLAKEMPLSTLHKSIEIKGKKYPIEYHVIGKIKAL